MQTLKTAGFTFGLVLATVLLAPPKAQAEGDWPYEIGSTSQLFDNNYSTYKTNQGVSTNVFSELLPINPFGNDGRVKLESRDVTHRGTGAARIDNARTGFQIDYNF